MTAKELDAKYPHRRERIHLQECKKCLAKELLMNEDVGKLSKELIYKEHLFVCAWRPTRLCKGICDRYAIDIDFIKEHKKKQK